jgi:hypothetical protein
MLIQELTVQKPRSLPSEMSMFLGDDQTQLQTKHVCNTTCPRPRGWSDVALGALFEMDFDTDSSADTDVVARSWPIDIQGQAHHSCCLEREATSNPFECESANGCCDGKTAETVVCNNLPNAGKESADSTVAEGAAISSASQSWACLTQRHTATRSVAIIQRKQQNSWRSPNTTR